MCFFFNNYFFLSYSILPYAVLFYSVLFYSNLFIYFANIENEIKINNYWMIIKTKLFRKYNICTPDNPRCAANYPYIFP